MKIRNLVFATAGAASLALVLSACGETGTNTANNKPMNLSTPANTSTPMNLTPVTNSNANHGNSTAPMNTKPMDNKPMMNANAKPAPTK